LINYPLTGLLRQFNRKPRKTLEPRQTPCGMRDRPASAEGFLVRCLETGWEAETEEINHLQKEENA